MRDSEDWWPVTACRCSSTAPSPLESVEDIADELAACVPASEQEVLELDTALAYLHEFLEPGSLSVLATVLELLLERHVLVVRSVARSLVAMGSEASTRRRSIRVDAREDDSAAEVSS
ncbi:MAG: hypothetical protein ACHREM_18980 [Polyangiales bacterium]